MLPSRFIKKTFEDSQQASRSVVHPPGSENTELSGSHVKSLERSYTMEHRMYSMFQIRTDSNPACEDPV